MKLRRVENWNDLFTMSQTRNKSICGLWHRLDEGSNQKQKKTRGLKAFTLDALKTITITITIALAIAIAIAITTTATLIIIIMMMMMMMMMMIILI